MNEVTPLSRRAERLLRWYPLAWRERYGSEFVDLMEQEMADAPRSATRTANIIYKGLKARLSDLGVVGDTVSPANQTRAAVATSFVFVAAFLVLALHYWSIGMNFWDDGGIKESFAVTAWLGAATVFAGILCLSVIAWVFSLLWFAGKDLIRHKTKGVATPLAVIVASIVFLVYMVYPNIRNALALQGTDWLQPGQVIKMISLETNGVLINVYGVWSHPGLRLNSGSITFALTPIVLVTFALCVARLIRRTEFSGKVIRISRRASISLSVTMLLFLVSYLGWVFSGGPPDHFHRLVDESNFMFNAELVLMIVIAALAVKTTFGQRRGRVIFPVVRDE